MSLASPQLDAGAPPPVIAPSAGTPRWLVLLLVVMVACGTAAAVTAPQSSSLLTRQASIPVLLADVDRGLVDTVYEDDNSVVWRPAGARLWSTAKIEGFDRAGAELLNVGDVLREAAAVNADARIEQASLNGPWAALQTIGILGGFGTFLLLIGGPDPRRGNRWAWFWLFYVGRSYQVGLLAFLLLGTALRGGHLEPARRLKGGEGLALAIVLGLVLSSLGNVLHDELFGTRNGNVGITYDTPSR